MCEARLAQRCRCDLSLATSEAKRRSHRGHRSGRRRCRRWMVCHIQQAQETHSARPMEAVARDCRIIQFHCRLSRCHFDQAQEMRHPSRSESTRCDQDGHQHQDQNSHRPKGGPSPRAVEWAGGGMVPRACEDSVGSRDALQQSPLVGFTRRPRAEARLQNGMSSSSGAQSAGAGARGAATAHERAGPVRASTSAS